MTSSQYIGKFNICREEHVEPLCPLCTLLWENGDASSLEHETIQTKKAVVLPIADDLMQAVSVGRQNKTWRCKGR